MGHTKHRKTKQNHSAGAAFKLSFSISAGAFWSSSAVGMPLVDCALSPLQKGSPDFLQNRKRSAMNANVARKPNTCQRKHSKTSKNEVVKETIGGKKIGREIRR